MRSGVDIVKDTISAISVITNPSVLSNNQTDSLAISKKQTEVLNKSIKPNNSIKQTKPPLAAKRTGKETKKAVMKSRKKRLG
jgi:hypothetical protein